MNRPLLPLALVIATLVAITGQDGRLGAPVGAPPETPATVAEIAFPVRSVITRGYTLPMVAEYTDQSALRTRVQTPAADGWVTVREKIVGAGTDGGTDVTLRIDPQTGMVWEYRWNHPQNGWRPVFTASSRAVLPEHARPGDPHLLEEGLWRAEGPGVEPGWSVPGQVYYQVNDLGGNRASVCLRLTMTDATAPAGLKVLDEHCFVTDAAGNLDAAAWPGKG